MKTVTLKIEGMSCGGCVARVKKAIEKAGGAVSADVRVGEARIEFEEGGVEGWVGAIEKLGFDVSVDETGVAI